MPTFASAGLFHFQFVFVVFDRVESKVDCIDVSELFNFPFVFSLVLRVRQMNGKRIFCLKVADMHFLPVSFFP